MGFGTGEKTNRAPCLCGDNGRFPMIRYFPGYSARVSNQLYYNDKKPTAAARLFGAWLNLKLKYKNNYITQIKNKSFLKLKKYEAILKRNTLFLCSN